MTSLAHKDDMFETPDWLIKRIQKFTGLKFNIDICANEKNKKCHYYISVGENALKSNWKQDFAHPTVAFCNPARSINGQFVDKAFNEWKEHNIDIVMLLCWNDLGNKYGEKLLPEIINGNIMVKNLGKVKFYKNGIESKFVSRLTYFWAWFKKK